VGIGQLRTVQAIRRDQIAEMQSLNKFKYNQFGEADAVASHICFQKYEIFKQQRF
jgi:hypothetical protein|tara:strand:- start:230 stop:394 length:165 start_codon:yes stop_codon:yes gene_type:complete